MDVLSVMVSLRKDMRSRMASEPDLLSFGESPSVDDVCNRHTYAEIEQAGVENKAADIYRIMWS